MKDPSGAVIPGVTDLRVARSFRVDRYRIPGFADIFNVLNARFSDGLMA